MGGVPAYWFASELLPLWWRPLGAQGFVVSLHSDKRRLSCGADSRYISDGRCEILASAAERLSIYADGLTHLLALYPVRGISRPLYRAIEETLLASGARIYHPSRDCRLLLVLPPGSSISQLHLSLVEQQAFKIKRLDSRGDSALRRNFTAFWSGIRSGIYIDLGVGIDAQSAQFVPYASLFWPRRLSDLREKAATRAARTIAESLIAAGAVEINPVLQWQEPLVHFWEIYGLKGPD